VKVNKNIFSVTRRVPSRLFSERHLSLLALVPLFWQPFAWSQNKAEGESFKHETTAGLEEIYLFRTARTTHTRGSTPACADTGVESRAEDFYALWSIALNSTTARVTDGHVKPVGGFTACFGPAVPNQPFKMFATGDVGRLHWTGRGECTPMLAQPPESTVRAFNCNLVLEGLPNGYVGGWLTSSTLAPILGADAPPDAHVNGYMSTSLVTMRLWTGPPTPGGR
jgi:hypothetical protein